MESCFSMLLVRALVFRLPAVLGCIPVETPGSGDLISAPQILEFDVDLGHFDGAWPKLGHKNVVFDQILGCFGHFEVALEKWAPVTLKTFYRPPDPKQGGPFKILPFEPKEM